MANRIKRVSSGIKGLDSITEGGFEENSVNILIGGSGNGKSIFSIQFLLDGIKNGEKCLYISFEEKKEEFYRNMLELGWDLEKYEKKDLFFFLEYTPEKVKTMLDEGGGAIETIVLTKKIDRVSIDSITAFAMLFEEEADRRQAALALFSMLRKWSITALLTYERDPLIDKRSSSRILEFESDSIIMLYFIRGEEQRNRYIEVIKMRGTNHSKEVYPYEIHEGGIDIKTNKPFKGKIKTV